MTVRTSRTNNKRSKKYYYDKIYEQIERLRDQIIEYYRNDNDNFINEGEVIELIKNKNGYYDNNFPSWAQERIDECILMCRIFFVREINND